MTYLAPRQGLFAIIILISFLIQTTLLVLSTDQQLDKMQKQTGDRMLVQLVEEVKLPLLSQDKVSLSVLTGRYISENNIANLTVKNMDNTVILQTGQAQLLNGEVLTKQVVFEGTIIGEVALTLQNISKGEIIASQWLFILGSFIVHLLIWLIYGYIARPTRAQLSALSRDVQDYFMSQHRVQLQRSRRDERSTDKNDREVATKSNARSPINEHLANTTDRNVSPNSINTDSQAPNSHLPKAGLASNGLNIQQQLNQYVQSHQAKEATDDFDSQSPNAEPSNPLSESQQYNVNQDNVNQDLPHQHRDDITSSNESSVYNTPVNNQSTSHQPSNHQSPHKVRSGSETSQSHLANINSSLKPFSAQRSMNVAHIQIGFYDPYHLINKLAPEQSQLYFILCTQLLQRTVGELMNLPILHGVEVKLLTEFSEKGASVELTSQTSHSKVALAGVMLAQAFKMLHAIIYKQFRQLKWFASNIYIGVSDDSATDKLQRILQNNAKADDILTLLPAAGLKQLSGHIQLNDLPDPTTVFERDTAVLKGVNETMMQRLVDVRNSVLLSVDTDNISSQTLGNDD